MLDKISQLYLFIMTCAVSLWAQADYIESVSGDLSNDSSAPTVINVQSGSNLVAGQTTSFNPFDRDIFTFTLDSMLQLDRIVLNDYNGPFGQGSFFALQAGSSISLDNPLEHLGNALIGVQPGLQASDDILDDLQTPLFGGVGFSAPLTADTYTFWLQETGGSTRYELDFQVSTVPVPAAFWLLISGIVGLLVLGRKGQNLTKV